MNRFEAMRESLRGGVQARAVPQLFETPPALARRVVELAEVKTGQRVLEPSAGTGRLIEALPDGHWVEAVELNLDLAAVLGARFPRVKVTCADFLDLSGADLGHFSRIVMNPPFANGADVEHVQHARQRFLVPRGGRLVAIVANGPRQRRTLGLEADEWHELEPGTFQGTAVRAALAVFTS